MKKIKFLKTLILLAFIPIIFLSCKKEEVETPTEKVNNWIYDVMKEVYYWTDEIPKASDKTLDHSAYFKSLLSQSDRFSILVPDFQELMNALQGVTKEAGYEFTLVAVDGSTTDIVAIITYVKDNSPAKTAGLLRGDVIFKVNGTTLTRTNYRDKMKAMEENHSIDFSRYNFTTQQLEAQPTLSLNSIVLAENPNHLYKIIETPNNIKVGYFVYNFFSPGPENAPTYDQQMDQIISDFKSAGVTELVLDLRYNSGGAVSSARNLGSLVAKGVDNTKIFYENRWNKLYQDYISKLQNGDQILRGRFIQKSENIGNNLSSSKIYILTGRNTASASELMINGLRPYMGVYIIGHKTVGKNVGSIPIEDDDNPDNKIGLLPIVFKTFNSLMQSDYGNGFNPDDEVEDLGIPMLELGDENEPLLARALEIISGSTSRRSEIPRKELPNPIKSSIDDKIRTNRMIFDHNLR
jgi:carboxyl-terminal processing protease